MQHQERCVPQTYWGAPLPAAWGHGVKTPNQTPLPTKGQEPLVLVCGEFSAEKPRSSAGDGFPNCF